MISPYCDWRAPASPGSLDPDRCCVTASAGPDGLDVPSQRQLGGHARVTLGPPAGTATRLWDELGRRRLQRFPDLAKMTHTTLGPDGFWGLTRDNPDMTYGVDTIRDVAEIINHELNPDATQVTPPSAPYPSWGIPDERIPPRLSRS